ncbi:AAA family ATPase [Micromonospora echinofusca]|uniref:AAA family ATPase n=1 Tax=Micromonospora echinofusca TaxID=47858 RepID=UPI0034D52943
MVLIGPPGAGKSTYAANRWETDRVLSLDQLRLVAAGNVYAPDATADLRTILRDSSRPSRRSTTVVDATNTHAADREWLPPSSMPTTPGPKPCLPPHTLTAEGFAQVVPQTRTTTDPQTRSPRLHATAPAGLGRVGRLQRRKGSCRN